MNFQSAFTPFHLNRLLLRNRFIKTATYEGMYRDGLPTPQLIDFHARIAAGGVAMTTVAYGAVSPDARTHEEQMYLGKRTIPGLKELTAAIHDNGAAAAIQLTHCGFFTRNRQVSNKMPLAPSRTFNEYGLMSGVPFSRAMTEDDIRATAADFGKAAGLAAEAGFDALEIHMGHGYLLSQFLSPATNRRKDDFGGSLSNRLRFPLHVIEVVRAVVGDHFPIICKINLSDGFKGGLGVEEATEVAKALENAGVDGLLLSGGYTSRTPFYLMRGAVPIRDMISVEKNRLQKIAIAVFGQWLIREYPFSENFFLPLARRVRKAASIPLIYLGGVVSRPGVEEVMQENFDLIAIGRALINDPDFILKLRSGEMERSPCDHCNKCVAEMDREGVRCVLRTS